MALVLHHHRRRATVYFQIEHGGNEPKNRQMSFVAQTDLTL